MRFVLPLILLFVAGCATPTTAPVDPTAFSLCRDLHGAQSWQREAESYLGAPVVIFECHGGTGLDQFGDKHWFIFPDPPMRCMQVEDAAWMLRREFPDRAIVLIVCNRAGYSIDVPNVWYCPHGLVYDWPGHWKDAPGNVGSFERFIRTDK